MLAPHVQHESDASLWGAFVRSVRDNTAAEVIVQALRIGGILLLARILAPHDFGVFSVLTVIASVAGIVGEAGIPQALIQRKELETAHEETGWYCCLVVTGVTMAALYAAAPIIARAMGMAELTGAIRLLCLPLLLDGASAIPEAQLQRQLKFGAIALAEVLGAAAFAIVAVLLANRGATRWSLPGGLAARYVVRAITILLAAPFIPKSLPRVAATRDLARFSSGVLAARVLHMISSNADIVLIGRMLGPSALGFYSVAWDLLRFLPDRLHRVAGRVALPAFARIQDRNEALAEAWRGFVSFSALLMLPILVCAAIASQELLVTLYGARWLPAAAALRWIAAGFLIDPLTFGISSLYYVKGHPSLDFAYNAVRLGLISIAVAILARGGLLAACAGVSAAELISGLLAGYLACVLIGEKFDAPLAAAWPGLRLAIACGVVAMCGKEAAGAAGLHPQIALAMIALPPTLLFVWSAGSLAKNSIYANLWPIRSHSEA
jgi:PST family polysaccharide transporter